MWPYPWTHVGTPSHLGHMDRVAATMPSQAHAGAAQEAPDIGQWEGQDVPLVRPSSCNVKGGIPSSRRYLPTYLPTSVRSRLFGCLGLSVFSGPGCPGPWRWFLSAVPGFPCSVFFFLFFSCLPPLVPFCVSRVAGGCSLVVVAPPPPLSLCLAAFVVPARCLGFFFFLLFCAPPLSLSVSGLRPVVPWALALCFVCFSGPPAARLSVRSRLVCLSCLAVGCSLVVAAPPPFPFVSRGFFRFCSVPWFFFFFLPLCSPVVSYVLWFPAPGALGLGAVHCLLC